MGLMGYTPKEIITVGYNQTAGNDTLHIIPSS